MDKIRKQFQLFDRDEAEFVEPPTRANAIVPFTAFLPDGVDANSLRPSNARESLSPVTHPVQSAAGIGVASVSALKISQAGGEATSVSVLKINITYDASCVGAPAGFKTAMEAAVKWYEDTFAVPITINITVGWGKLNGKDMPDDALGVSTPAAGISLTYTELRNALWQDARTPDAMAAALALPLTDPTNGGTIFISSAEAKALGLVNPQGSQVDGYLALDSAASYTFDPDNRAVPGCYDAIATIEHEISHILGRISFLGEALPDGTGLFSGLDLFRYNASGVRAPASAATSFCFDGHTLLLPFNDPENGGTSSDWSVKVHGDAFCAFAEKGVQDQISATDYSLMDVLGYHRLPAVPYIQPPAGTPSGVITVDGPITISSGQAVYIDGSGYGWNGGDGAVSNSGTILSSCTAQSVAYGVSGPVWGSNTGTITNDVTGVIVVENTVGAAYGFYFATWGPNVSNAGRVQVTSLTDYAFGLRSYSPSMASSFVNAATGYFGVWGAGETYGVKFENGGSFDNAGTLEATGAGAVGVYGATTFSNTGTIRATNTKSGESSIGVELTLQAATSIMGRSLVTLRNVGTIIGDYAVAVAEWTLSPPFEPVVNFTNTGTVIGAVALCQGGGKIENTGTIAGNLYFGDGNTVYRGAAGHLFGDVYLGHATNTVTLGGDGGSVYGGGGCDTITGGSGDDFIEIARGSNVINGGGGFNTLSLVPAAMGYTVDLGKGTAKGAGVTTIAGIQQVIGTDFDDVLIAGATAAILSGRAGHDTLIGGAGDDTLIAGDGGDQLRGGGGADTFVYSKDGGPLVIDDFDASRDTLKIYGYSSGTLTQNGSDLLITLSAGDSILLKNSSASSLAGSCLVYCEKSYDGPLVPPSLPQFGTSTIHMLNDWMIYQGEVIAIDGEEVGFYDDGYYSGDLSLKGFDNFGNISITKSAGGSLVGLEWDSSSSPGGQVVNEAGASFVVSSSGGSICRGLRGYSHCSPVINAGRFEVTGDSAIGIETWGELSFTNTVTGTFTVSENTSTAQHSGGYGVYLHNGGSVVNDGVMTVSCAETATVYGLFLGNGYTVLDGMAVPATIKNSGSLTVANLSGGDTCAIYVGGTGRNDPVSLINTGTITAKTAIQLAGQSFNNTSSGPPIVVTNSGTITGDIDFGGDLCSLVNTGTINGNILLHDDCLFSSVVVYRGGTPTDVIDLRGGTLNGSISITAGLNGRLSSGGQNYQVHDTIYTGGAAIPIKIAGGQKLLLDVIGGAGVDTVKLDLSADGAGITAGLDGSNYKLSDGAGVIVNVTAAEQFDIAGGAGNDRLSGGLGNDTLDGGVGLDTAVFYGNRSAYTITRGANGTMIVSGADGTDTLHLIERLAFDDQIIALTSVPFDANGDGSSDIIWQNDSGAPAIWTMDGFQQLGGSPVGGNPGTSWHIKGTADFNGDGYADILWQNDNGAANVWTMNGFNQLAGGYVGGNPGAAWHVKGTGDFNGDGKADILWQNDNGQAAIWTMDGLNQLGGSEVGINPGTDWHIKGTGDFNGDGKSDILWQNDNGQAAIWLMDGFNVASGSYVGGNPGTDWHVMGAGDFDGDGTSDILWQNDNGQAAIWTMNGLAQTGGSPVGGNPGASWHAKCAGDYNGDGCADILWQNDNGQAAIWMMNGLTQTGGSLIGGNPGTSWHVQAGVG